MPADPAERFVTELANVFRETRERVGMSQNQLAVKSGVGRTGIIMFEQHERIPSALLLKRLAQGLERRLGSLVEEAEGRVGLGHKRR